MINLIEGIATEVGELNAKDPIGKDYIIFEYTFEFFNLNVIFPTSNMLCLRKENWTLKEVEVSPELCLNK